MRNKLIMILPIILMNVISTIFAQTELTAPNSELSLLIRNSTLNLNSLTEADARIDSSSVNLLANGDFENGAVGWIPLQGDPGTSAIIDNSIYFDGSASAQIQIESDSAVVAAGWLQGVAVKPGHYYLFEYAVKTQNANLMAFSFFNYVDGSVKFVSAVFPSAGTTDWTVYRCRLIIPPEINELHIFLLLYGYSGTAWFDAVVLHELSDTSSTIFNIDLASNNGNINPYLSTNVGPVWERNPHDLSSQFQEIGIDMVRTHDYYGACDIHTIFPDMSADPFDSSAYDFSATDAAITTIINSNCKILFRLGESYEAAPVHNKPPSDFEKWAQVCVQIIKHYNDGWNNGFYYNINYWEIWNEPDLKWHWDGTASEFAKLYRITANKIKQHDPLLKVGGPAIAYIASENFITTFLDSIVAFNTPLDFISYHSYFYSNPYFYIYADSIILNYLSHYDLTNVETYLTEWNNYSYDVDNVIDWGRDDALNAAQTAASIIYLQETKLSKAFRYRTDEYYFGLFRYDGSYSYSGLVFKALGSFYDTPIHLAAVGSDRLGSCILAGKSDNGGQINILVANNSSSANGYRLCFNNMLNNEYYLYSIYRINNDNEYVKIDTGRIDGFDQEFNIKIQAPFVDHLILHKQYSKVIEVIENKNEFILKENYPNPFNPQTTISYQLPVNGDVALKIYNMLGKEVRTLVKENKSAGYHSVIWDGKDNLGASVVSGVYFYQLKSGDNFSQTKKLLLLK